MIKYICDLCGKDAMAPTTLSGGSVMHGDGGNVEVVVLFQNFRPRVGQVESVGHICWECAFAAISKMVENKKKL